MTSNTQALHSLKIEREKIDKLMKQVKDQLARIDKGELSANAPYISLVPASSIEDLRSPHKNLQAALRSDLQVLRQQLRAVKAGQRAVHRAAVGQDIAATKKKLKQHIETMVKDGEVTADELAHAQKMADHILEKSLGLMNGDPSTGNIKNVVDALADTQLLGADPDSGSSATAMRDMLTAGKKRHAKAEQNFRRTPSSKNFRNMIGEASLTQMFGGDGEASRPGWKPAGDIQCTTTDTDTLSGLSEKYYGALAYWDIIYLRNYGAIGHDPDQMRGGIDIIVP